MFKIKPKNSNLIVRIAGLFILIIILLKINKIGYLNILKKVALFPLIIAALLNLFKFFIDAWRWKYLISMQGRSYSIKDSFLAILSSDYLGIATPGRIGSFLRVFYLVEDINISAGLALSNIMVDKLLELVVLLGLGVWGLFMIQQTTLSLALIGIAVLFLLFFFFIIGSKNFHLLIENILIKWVRLGRFTNNIDQTRVEFDSGLGYFYNEKIIIPTFITLLGFLCLFLQAYFILISMRLELPFLDVCRSISMSRMIARLVPVSFLGLGSKDVFLIMVFKKLGINVEQGIIFSLLFLLTSFIVSGISGAISWFIKPIRIIK